MKAFQSLKEIRPREALTRSVRSALAAAVVGGAILLTLPGAVAGQASGAGDVAGQVLVLVDGDTPEGLEVNLVEAGRSTLVNRAGRFAFAKVPEGSHTVQVSYRGVELDRRSIDVFAGESVDVTFRPGSAASSPTPAAQGPPPTDLERVLDLLVARGVLTEGDAAGMLEQAARDRAARQVPLARQDLGYEPTAVLRDDRVTAQVVPFGIQSWDGSSRFRVRGRGQLDAGWQNFDEGIQDVARQDHEFPDYGVIFRRVRLGVAGIMRQDWEWQVEVDFSENEVDLANVYVAYLFPNGRLAAGHFKEPFGMEYATSSRYITFLERSAASDAFKVNREPGLMYETLYRRWYAGLGIFGGGLLFDREVREGWSVNARLSAAPYLADRAFVHVGGGINHRKNAFSHAEDRWEDVRLRTREGTRTIDARLIGRDDLVAVEQFTRMNLEFAAGTGPLWIQSEYLRVNADLDRERLVEELGGNATDQSSLTQDGWYVQGGVFLTGESKPYRAFSGDFGRLRPHRNFSRSTDGIGAIELAFGVSTVDALEHTRPGRGQKLTRYTGGLNWHLTPEIALKTNVIYLEGERDVYEGSGWVYAIRVQFLY